MKSADFAGPGIVQQYGAILVRLSGIMDAAFILAALYLVVGWEGETWSKSYLALGLVAMGFFLVTTHWFDLYRSWRLARLRHEISKLSVYLAATFGFTVLIVTFGGWEAVASQLIPRWFVTAFVAMVAARVAMRMLLRYVRAHGYDHRKVVFAGCNGIAKNLSETFSAHPWMGIDVVGYFDDRSPDGDRQLAIPKADLSGSIADLLRLAQHGDVDAVYVCLPMAAEKRIKGLIDSLADTTVSVHFCPSFFEFGMLYARWDEVFGQPVISIVDSPFNGPNRLVKRTEDVVLTLAVLPVVALPMLLIAAAIKVSSPGPVFFRQMRHGIGGKLFQIWKFRTMHVSERDEEFRQARKSDPRVTPLGAYLRASSLDELPQLFNVLRGDMSIVGPRPHPLKLNETHRGQIDRFMLRHKVKPGITGLAQVNGFRGETDDGVKMARRVENDLTYIRQWSLWLDLKILLRTVIVVLSGRNAH